MKSKVEVVDLLACSTKEMEKAIGFKVSNGQGLKAIRKTLAWVLK